MDPDYAQHLQNIHNHGPSSADFIVAMDAYQNKVAIVWNNHIEICIENQRKIVQIFGGLLENDQGPDVEEVGRHFTCGKFFRNWFFAGTVLGTVEMFNVGTGKLIKEFDSIVGVISLDCSPKQLTAVLEDGDIFTWNIKNDNAPPLVLQVNRPRSIMYHPNGGKEMLVISEDDTTTLCRLDGHIVHTFENCRYAVFSPSGHTVAVNTKEGSIKFCKSVTREFSNIEIQGQLIKYIGEDKVLCSEDDDIRVYYVDTGILICKKKIQGSVNVKSVVVVSNTILYSYLLEKKIHSFRLPHYNYSRMKTRRLQTGIVEGIAAANNHPLVLEGDLDNSPLQDRAHFTKIFAAIRETKKRQSQETHQTRRRQTMAADTIKKFYKLKRF
jgi:WD40 repeat protein